MFLFGLFRSIQSLSCNFLTFSDKHENVSLNVGLECPFYGNNTASTQASSLTGVFDWDAKQQGIILGSFYYGYIITMIPGGYIAERYSSKYVILFASLGATICTVLSPIGEVCH